MALLGDQTLARQRARGSHRDSQVVETTLQAIVKALDRTKSTAQHMFRGADVDGSGYLSAREIELLLRDRVGLTLSPAEVQQLIAALDTKGTGTISSVEFISRIRKVQRDLKARHRREQERIVRPRAPEPQMPEEETTALSAEERMKQVEHLKRILVGEDLAQHHSETPLPKAAVKAAAEAAAAAEASAAKAAAAEASEGVGDLASRLLAWEWDKPQQPEEAPGAPAESVPAGWASGGEQAQLLREMALATGSNEVERAAFVNAELTAQREMLASRLAEQQAEWGKDGPAGSAGPISAVDSERDALRMRSMEQHQQLLAAELARKQAEADSSLSPISLDGKQKQPEPQPEPQPRLSRAAAVDQMLKEAADAMPAVQTAADGTEAAQWQQRLDSLKVQHAAARAPEAVSTLSPQPTTLSDSSRALSASAQAPGESSPQSPLSPVLAGRWTQGDSGAGTLHYQPGQDIAAKLQRLKASRDRSGAGLQAGPALSLEPLPAVVQPAQALRAATGAAETAAKPEPEPEPASGGVSPQHPLPTGTLHILSPRSRRANSCDAPVAIANSSPLSGKCSEPLCCGGPSC